jgi:hypothetical protein
MLSQKLLPTFDAIATGGTAVCDMNLNQRIHCAVLELGDAGAALGGGSIAANIPKLVNDIRVKVNSKVQRTMTGLQLNQLNGYHGSAYGAVSIGTDGAGPNPYRIYLPIYFAAPWRTNTAQVEASAWNLAGIDSMSIEVDIATGLTTPVVTGFYDYDAPTANTIGAIEKWIRANQGCAGQIFDFTKMVNPKDYIFGVHMFATSDGKYVNKFKMTANGTDIRDLMNYTEIQALQEFRGKVTDSAAAPRMDIEFDYDLELDNSLNANGLDMTFHVELSAASAGTMTVITRRMGAPE